MTPHRCVCGHSRGLHVMPGFDVPARCTTRRPLPGEHWPGGAEPCPCQEFLAEDPNLQPVEENR